ncbi:MAG: GGDEF domain-containing protein [Oscillospiraceae bacterium]|nr:GGDEF domain-containing protein [Oscillospiraceae bacterium]
MSLTIKNSDSKKRFQKIRGYMIAGYALIIIIASVCISGFAIKKTDEVLKSKVSSMTSMLNIQMKLNINSYLKKMETTGTLIFSSEEVYTYDATNPDNDQYEALNTEKIISDKLFNLCIMENFVDFGIVYSNNHTVGKISNGTVKLFNDKLYYDLSSMINRKRTHDGWATGYKNNYKRIYYVKRVNENAILVTSFYTTELESVFEHPDGMNDITVRLAENNHVIIYSSEDNETGSPIPYALEERIDNQNSVTLIDDEYLITINGCGDNWYVICSVPTKIILDEKNEIQVYILAVSIIASILAIIAGSLVSIKITNPVNQIVTNLDTKAHIDLLTGVLNKRSFEEAVENTLNSINNSRHNALILLDVDNFKGVNDTLGHSYGDKVLADIGNILNTVFTTDDYTGRLGGDEFCVLLNIPLPQQKNYMNLIKEKCDALSNAFHNNYTGDDNKYKISASIGVAVFPNHGRNFPELYKCADKALYESKHKGKDMYTIFCSDLNGGDNN